jgi:glycosyltransferase involved in cell wall biosynthesis
MRSVLVICSWLDLKTKISSFFSLQSAILIPEYNPILVVFHRVDLGLRTFLLKKLSTIKINKEKCQEELNVYEIYYPSFWFFPKIVNRIFRKIAIDKLKLRLDQDRVEVSIIHAQSLFNAGIWAYDFSKKFNIPYIFTEHNQLTLRGASIKKQHLITEVIKSASRKLVVSNDKIRQFATNGYYDNFINVGNLITDNFNYKGYNLIPGKLRITTIGAFNPIKDQETLFKALQLIDQNSCEICIELVWIGCNGWGINKEAEVNKMLENYKLVKTQINILPILEREEIATIFAKTDIFVFTSISEGMPVSVLEALACGLPVFTSNCGGVDELIHEGNGRVFQLKDIEKLSDLILRYLNNEFSFDRKLISQEILKKYGKNAFRKKVINIYNSVLND